MEVVAQEAITTARITPPRHEAEQAAPLRVLIADDVKETRRSARLMMTLMPGVEVVALARNGREALLLARKHRPDIALMDINMPEMDGLAVARAMQKHLPQIACVIMSAYRDNEILLESMASGARGYLIKPFTTDQLTKVMEKVVSAVNAARQLPPKHEDFRQQRDIYLRELGAEYLRTRRTDERAQKVFELLAAEPSCDARWLVALIPIYLVRRQWSQLKQVAQRLEEMAE